MPSKTCPNCHHHYTMKSFLRITSHRFNCHNCEVELNADLHYFILGALLVAPIMGLAISTAICNPIMWLLVPVSMVAAFFIYYWFFGVTLFHNDTHEE